MDNPDVSRLGVKYKPQPGTAPCPECGSIQKIIGWPVFTKRDAPIVAARLMKGDLFEHTCPKCGYFDVLTYTSVYLDEDADAAIVFGRNFKNELYASDELFGRIQSDPVFDVRTARWVTHVDDMSEKARIFDCGLDDRAVEVAKLMAIRWLSGKDELHELSKIYFSRELDNGDLLLKVLAVSDTANEEIEFFRSEYDEIKEGVNGFDPYDASIVVDRGWAERFLAESAAREAGMLLQSVETDHLRLFAGTASELREAFNLKSMVGKKIVSIDVVGKMAFPTHQTMIDLYNNIFKTEEEPYRRDVIAEDEIPLDFERTRSIAPNGPLVLGFDDGSALEITFDNASEVFLAWGQSGERQPNREVDASKILHPIIGETVSAVEVVNASEGSYEWMCAEEEGREDPFKHILIRCEDHMLYITWTYTCTVMPNDTNLTPLSMTIGELKDSISYYEELFDQDS